MDHIDNSLNRNIASLTKDDFFPGKFGPIG
jgi:hypothetical protein